MSPKAGFKINSLTAEKKNKCDPPHTHTHGTPLFPFLWQVKRSCPCGLEAGSEKKERGNPISVQLFPPELVSLEGLVRIVNTGLRGNL